MSFADIVHRLCKAPWGMLPRDVAELTAGQARLLLESRDDDSAPGSGGGTMIPPLGDASMIPKHAPPLPPINRKPKR